MTASLKAPPRLSVVRTAPKVTPDPEITQTIASAKAMSARALSLQIEAGRVLGSAQALNKKQYAAEMVNAGLDKTQGNKLIAAAAAADAMPSADVAAFLSPHLLIQLGQKRNQAALDAITDDDTQLSVVEKIKKYRTPAAPKEKKSVRRVGNQKGGTPKLVIEVPPGPHVEEIYSDYEKSGTPVAQWLGGLVNRDHDSFLRSPDLPDLEENSDYTLPSDSQQSESASTTDLGTASGYTSSTLPPCPKSENLDEQETVQAELDAYIDFQGQSIAPLAENCEADQAWTLLCEVRSPEDSSPNTEVAPSLELNSELQAFVAPPETQLDTELPSSAPESLTEQDVAQAEFNEYVETQAQSIAPESQLDAPPIQTVRYKKGWQVGNQVVANTVGGYFASWCEGKPVTIVSVQGKVGEIQIIHVVRHDGAKDMTYGNWIEEIPDKSVEPSDAPLPSQAQDTFYLVGDIGNEWEDEVVKLISRGRVHNQVSRIDDDTWTNILPKFLKEISFEEVMALQNTSGLAEKVFAEFGLGLGDMIEWKVEDVTLTGKIVRLTKLGAFIDEGQPGFAWIKYPRLSKVMIEGATAFQFVDSTNQQSMVNSSTLVGEQALEVDPNLLSEALKKAKNWQEIEKIVDRNSFSFAKAVKRWTIAEKNGLIELLVNYLEENPDALLTLQVDWLPLASLEKSFKLLSFKVRDIQEGVTAPWRNGCEFIKVEDFRKNAEEWTFFDPTSSQNIKVYDREDFQVVAF